MNAGKSTTLLQASFNYRERGMETIEFTAKIDDRVESGVIASRIGLRKNAHNFDAATDLFDIVQRETATMSAACVFLDEAQFLSAGHVLRSSDRFSRRTVRGQRAFASACGRHPRAENDLQVRKKGDNEFAHRR